MTQELQSQGDSTCPTSKCKRASLNSKRTLRLLNHASSVKYLHTVEPLYSFKERKAGDQSPRATIPASSREQAKRLYAGPTIRAAMAWQSLHDSPGPQAYSEGSSWKLTTRRSPSARIAVAKCDRDLTPPRTPGPGEYNVTCASIGDSGKAPRFFRPSSQSKRLAPGTTEKPTVALPCSHEGDASYQQKQATPGRPSSPSFFFDRAPRFKVTAAQ